MLRMREQQQRRWSAKKKMKQQKRLLGMTNCKKNLVDEGDSMSDFTIISNAEYAEFIKLREFYKQVALLTLNHDVLYLEKQEEVVDGGVILSGGAAVVYPSKLGPLLEKIDPEWYMKVDPPN